MSQIPSNTEQFLGGLASSQGFLQQAGSNQLAQQQMGLERSKMAQQGRQFDQGLQAESENYRRLNESRERQQRSELEQQGSQFNRQMDFNKEQANLERMISLKLKQIDMDLEVNEAEIASMVDDDPRLVEARAKRRKYKGDIRNLEQMMGSSQLSMQLAQGVKGDRIDEVDARLDAFKGGLSTRRSAAEKAMKNGLDYAVLQDAREGGFIREVARVDALRGAGEDATNLQPADGGTIDSVFRILVDNLTQWGLDVGSPELAQDKATEFMKNGGAMAIKVVTNALEMSEDAFGLDPGNQAKAVRVAGDLVAKASILAGVDPKVRAGKGAGPQHLRTQIAKGFGELRRLGMGDEQIGALLEGLESMSENRVELLRSYAERDPNSMQAGILEGSLTGVGRIQDVLEAVANNQELMAPHQGKLVDHSRYDWTGVTRKARVAYGMGQNPELERLMGEMRSLGMPDTELEALTKLLIESDPNLQFLRPEEFAQALRGMSLSRDAATENLEVNDEDIGRFMGQGVARGRLQGLQGAEQQLSDLAGKFGG